MSGKPIEIFWGTGGVGKTTLATSRALYLARAGRRILLITIDPAKRLRQIIGAGEGVPSRVSSEALGDAEGGFSFDALLFSPRTTFERIVGSGSRIVNTLMRQHGGMNEIMAVIEIQHHLASGCYDTVVLDTPPGKHFIDFLESTQKINSFFDKKFMEVFRYLASKARTKKRGLLDMVVKTGMETVLKHMGKITGEGFVDEFIGAMMGLYDNRDAFLKALKFEEDLQKKRIFPLVPSDLPQTGKDKRGGFPAQPCNGGANGGIPGCQPFPG